VVGTDRLLDHDAVDRHPLRRRMALRDARADGRDYENRITYVEIVKPKRIVYRHGGGEDLEPVIFEVEVTFEEVGKKTKLTMQMVFPSAEECARVIKEYGADKGLTQTLARLGEYVERMQ
jgi:uncharacterized protein YndB with AHSA1/START domain